jgi:predicted phosphodiesterase
MTHIGGYPGHYTAAVKAMMSEVNPDIFICGHSHILRVMHDEKFNNMIVMNPGAAGVHGWHKVKTVLRFSLENKKVLHLEAVELGQRGKIENTEDPNEY